MDNKTIPQLQHAEEDVTIDDIPRLLKRVKRLRDVCDKNKKKLVPDIEGNPMARAVFGQEHFVLWKTVEAVSHLFVTSNFFPSKPVKQNIDVIRELFQSLMEEVEAEDDIVLENCTMNEDSINKELEVHHWKRMLDVIDAEIRMKEREAELARIAAEEKENKATKDKQMEEMNVEAEFGNAISMPDDDEPTPDNSTARESDTATRLSISHVMAIPNATGVDNSHNGTQGTLNTADGDTHVDPPVPDRAAEDYAQLTEQPGENAADDPLKIPEYGFSQDIRGSNASIDGYILAAKDENNPIGCVGVGAQPAFDNSGYYAELKVVKATGGLGSVGLGLSTADPSSMGSTLPPRLDQQPQGWYVGGPYPDDPKESLTMNVYCNSKKNLRFVYAHAKSKEQQVMNWRPSDTLGVWVRRRDGRQNEWLLSVFVNHNRIFTCNCQIPDTITDSSFRIIAECVGSVKAVKLITNAHPPSRLALNYWYNPLREGAQRIIENILFIDESCASKSPLKVDWTMSMSPCNISHTETKKCKILQWGNESLKSPLTRLPELDKTLAIKCSKMILVLMGNRVLEKGKEPGSEERAKIAYTLFWYFKHRHFLRDEILLFIVKQLTKNPERKSILFGYVLLQILMEGAVEANYHLPILVEDFLTHQNYSDKKIQSEVKKTLRLYKEVHEKFAALYRDDEKFDKKLQKKEKRKETEEERAARKAREAKEKDKKKSTADMTDAEKAERERKKKMMEKKKAEGAA